MSEVKQGNLDTPSTSSLRAAAKIGLAVAVGTALLTLPKPDQSLFSTLLKSHTQSAELRNKSTFAVLHRLGL